jgi:hypothetical protein
MAEQHLAEVLNKVTAPKEIKNLVRSLFNKLQEKTLSQVRQKYIDLALNKNQKVKAKKQELNKSPSSRQVQNLQKEENLAELRQREEESRDFIKKMKKDQKERERRQKEREEEERYKQLEEDKIIERRKQEESLRAEEEKIRRLKELKEKSSKRKKEIKNLIELGNQEYKKVISAKPLHEKIEEKYFSKVLMPELERHKLELAKKREMLQPINRSAILEHAKKHDQVIEEHEMQKRNQSQENNYDVGKLRSKFTLAYIEDQKRRRQEQDKEQMEKKSLVEKKKQYAELVLEMYQPTIDPAKQLELKLIKERLKEGGFMKKKRSARSLSAKDESDSEKPLVPKKKWKKNPMIPQPPQKKEPVVIDWLMNQRKQRENQRSQERLPDGSWEEGLSKEEMKKKLENIEKEMRKKEMKLQIANSSNLKGIETTGDISDMLINSIKGKLAILES